MLEPQSGTVLASMTFSVTPDDLAASYRANARWACSRPRFYIIMILGFLLITAIDAALSVTPTMLSLLPGLIFVLWMLVYRPLVHILAPFSARRTFRQQKNLQQPWRVDLSDNGLRAITPTQDNYIAWTDYIAWSQNNEIILVYQSDRLLQFIPTRAADAAALSILHSKLAGVPRR